MEQDGRISCNTKMLHDLIIIELQKLGFGLSILDTQIGSGEFGFIDILAVDENSKLIILDIQSDQKTPNLIKLINKFKFISDIRFNLKALYSDFNINAELTPSLIVLSESFSSQFCRSLSFITFMEMRLIKYEVISEKGLFKVKLEKIKSDPESMMKININSKLDINDLKKKLKELDYNISDKEIEEFLSFYK